MIFLSGRMSCEGARQCMRQSVGSGCNVHPSAQGDAIFAPHPGKGGQLHRKVCSQCMSHKVQTVDALTLGSAGYALARLFLQELGSLVA